MNDIYDEHETYIEEVIEEKFLEDREELENLMNSYSWKELEKNIIKRVLSISFQEKYCLIRNTMTEEELYLLFSILQKKYDFKSYLQRKNPNKETLEEERRYYTIKELARKYGCSESTIKRRLGTKK